jgi:hypothetical protein
MRFFRVIHSLSLIIDWARMTYRLTTCCGISLSRRGQRKRLWSKVLSDTAIGCFADSDVNEKRFCIGFALVLSLCQWQAR